MKIWFLILVKRGCIQEPEVFYNELSAEKRKREILRDFSRDYDELDIFEKEIEMPICNEQQKQFFSTVA